MCASSKSTYITSIYNAEGLNLNHAPAHAHTHTQTQQSRMYWKKVCSGMGSTECIRQNNYTKEKKERKDNHHHPTPLKQTQH